MATLDQIRAKVKELQTQADALIARKAQAAVDQVRKLMLAHGLTTADIERKAKARRDAKAAKAHGVSQKPQPANVPKSKLPAKYLNPKTGETWSGHARPPKWIAEAKDRAKFLIDGLASKAAKSTKPAAKDTSRNGKLKGALPPKYRDPKSGATWSGRGPAPAWLASAKDRNKFLIDAGGVVKSATSAAGKAMKSKAAVASKKTAKAPTGARKTATAKTASAARKKASGSTAKPVAAKKAPARKSSAGKRSPASAGSGAAATAA
ncbi:histone family protein nucleoid-structuring protein H-NS [Caballeronia choica]|uniref:Histone family protein nucleoid-structuring protein H-NS n=1 Tax=Caballeronia choica TaxID=326476 RepID=A0A158KLJ0_9BURK|nr:H-NS family nucleoid-associated regulatory protein [Caballeronia choica]SAL81997.1 histone family protein nucleoid-structuring protein H-NS [Caballeronia choica]